MAFIYDLPKEDKYTSAQLTDIIAKLGFRCEVQLDPHSSKKPFQTARAKFESEA